MVQNLNRVCGGGFQAKGEDLVNPFGMALVANEMPFNTAGFAPLFFVAERAFHFSAAGKIFQRRAAEQALFLHDHCLPVSYTHLDVYKRQDRRHSRRGRTG